MISEDRTHPEVRQAITRLCADYPDEYWRDKDRDKAYRELRKRVLGESQRLGSAAATKPAPAADLAAPVAKLGVDEVDRLKKLDVEAIASLGRASMSSSLPFEPTWMRA